MDSVSKQGDPEASLEAYRPRIVRHIRTLVRNSADAEDLAQETLLRAQRHLESLREPAALGIWLYRIATHVALDFLRQVSRRSEVTGPPLLDEAEQDEGSPAGPEAPRLDQLIDQSQMSRCVQDFLEALPDSSRVAILLHDLHGPDERGGRPPAPLHAGKCENPAPSGARAASGRLAGGM